jgi:hypothetical protein
MEGLTSAIARVAFDVDVFSKVMRKSGDLSRVGHTHLVRGFFALIMLQPIRYIQYGRPRFIRSFK